MIVKRKKKTTQGKREGGKKRPMQTLSPPLLNAFYLTTKSAAERVRKKKKRHLSTPRGGKRTFLSAEGRLVKKKKGQRLHSRGEKKKGPGKSALFCLGKGKRTWRGEEGGEDGSFATREKRKRNLFDPVC